jgi:hypothetical protein
MNSLFRFPHRVRIHGGECGAVARALHHKAKINSLPAVGENVLLTTNERKSMSTKTNFKRLALGVIAALGLGMLSVAPATAVAGVPTLTVTTGSAPVTMGEGGETETAATLSISGLLTGSNDSYTVAIFLKSAGGTMANARFRLAYLETTTSDVSDVRKTYAGAAGNSAKTAPAYTGDGIEAVTAFESATATSSTYALVGTSTGYVGAKFGLFLESSTVATYATAQAQRTGNEGTYVYTAVVTPYTAGVAGTAVQADLTFTLNKTAAAVAAASGTIDPSKSTAFLGTAAGATADASISKVATAATTAHGYINVITKTSTSLQAPESVTITVTGPGLVCNPAATVCGKSITHAADGNDDFPVRADGTAGISSIVVKTTTVTFPAKTITFYAKAAKTITASTNHPVINVGANAGAVLASAVDADGNVWGGVAYIYASTAADALIAGSNATPAQCTFDAGLALHLCPVTGTAKGTANLKVIDAATVALATATSNEVSTRVSTGVPTTAKLSFDKATYAPGEKAQVRVQVLDEAGLAMPYKVIANAFTSTGISTSKAFQQGTLAASGTVTVAAATSATSDTNAGHYTQVVYMPMSNGVVTITATGSTGLGLAGRVDLSASATVTNNDPAVAAATAAAEAAADAAAEAIDAANAATDAANLAAEAADAATVAAEEARDAADAATAAVEELATQVATLMAALKAQITTLANTVAKIAKKVRA